MLFRLLKMLKKPKPRRLKDRRKDDKGIEHRVGSNGHEPRFKLSPTKGNPKPRASDWIRVEGGWVQGKRFRKDRRREIKFAIDKRKAIDRYVAGAKIATPIIAASTAAGAYNRKKKKKKLNAREKTFDQKLESIHQEFKGSKLKRVQ